MLADIIIITIGGAFIAGYFAWNHGFNRGINAGTEMTLYILEKENIVHVDDNGNVSAAKRTRKKSS